MSGIQVDRRVNDLLDALACVNGSVTTTALVDACKAATVPAKIIKQMHAQAEFPKVEAQGDDLFLAILDALGFNEYQFLTLSRNRLTFNMSGTRNAQATADITVIDVLRMIRLIVAEDKNISESQKSDITVHEPQMVAEAIAASQWNMQFKRRKDHGGEAHGSAVDVPKLLLLSVLPTHLFPFVFW